MKQYMQADLEADRQVAQTLVELITGGLQVSVVVKPDGDGDISHAA